MRKECWHYSVPSGWMNHHVEQPSRLGGNCIYQQLFVAKLRKPVTTFCFCTNQWPYMLSSAWNSNDQLTRFNTNLTKRRSTLEVTWPKEKKGRLYYPSNCISHIIFSFSAFISPQFSPKLQIKLQMKFKLWHILNIDNSTRIVYS
jgi:hypothetical protein